MCSYEQGSARIQLSQSKGNPLGKQTLLFKPTNWYVAWLQKHEADSNWLHSQGKKSAVLFDKPPLKAELGSKDSPLPTRRTDIDLKPFSTVLSQPLVCSPNSPLDFDQRVLPHRGANRSERLVRTPSTPLSLSHTPPPHQMSSLEPQIACYASVLFSATTLFQVPCPLSNTAQNVFSESWPLLGSYWEKKLLERVLKSFTQLSQELLEANPHSNILLHFIKSRKVLFWRGCRQPKAKYISRALAVLT